MFPSIASFNLLSFRECARGWTLSSEHLRLINESVVISAWGHRHLKCVQHFTICLKVAICNSKSTTFFFLHFLKFIQFIHCRAEYLCGNIIIVCVENGTQPARNDFCRWFKSRHCIYLVENICDRERDVETRKWAFSCSDNDHNEHKFQST